MCLARPTFLIIKPTSGRLKRYASMLYSAFQIVQHFVKDTYLFFLQELDEMIYTTLICEHSAGGRKWIALLRQGELAWLRLMLRNMPTKNL